MSSKAKQADPIPAEFASYEEAADFWDTHDATDYPDSFETVSVEADLQRRHFEVEVDEDLIRVLAPKAHERGIAVGRLVNEMLREKTLVP